MDPLFSYINVHTNTLQLLSSFIFKKSSSVASITNLNPIKSSSITMATITPAQTTTQLLLSNTQPCILPLRQKPPIDLSLLLQNNCCMIGPLQPSIPNAIEIKDPPAAQQPKRPAWTESHAYLRGSRTNGSTLRILSTELNMIRASKITRSLRPRRSCLSKRQDDFVWGRTSSLRINSTSL
ncbi:hypothetical protein BD408DRAFT_421826 [Parasitella parasitica]|nr:hypothetical protein BD408DRAFT_421826 [Parasitella parasitica]